MQAIIFNIGCKVNQYECDVLAEKLLDAGCSVSEELGFADVYILNTCAVTNEAERKSRQAIKRCRNFNPESKIYVCGCASEKNAQAFDKDGVVYVTGVAGKTGLVEKVLRDMEKKTECASKFIYVNSESSIPQKDVSQIETLTGSALFTEDVSHDEFQIHSVSSAEDITHNKFDILSIPSVYENDFLSRSERTRAYVKIQDGCNSFCSYCIIPYLRGRSRSRKIDAVLRETAVLARTTSEIVLTGINLMQYGIDTGESLTQLIRALGDIDARIRLGSFYAEGITQELLDALFDLKKFCPHFHLSLQSGDDTVLRAMNRKYTTDIYSKKIDMIRTIDPFACITTDIITGFPNETEENHRTTIEYIKRTRFADIHIFPYSPREGTAASKLKRLSPDIVRRRRDELLLLKEELRTEFLTRFVGKPQKVLIEQRDGEWNSGYSEYYLRIYTKQDGSVVDCFPTQLYKEGLKEG